jgi:hypothetical protein
MASADDPSIYFADCLCQSDVQASDTFFNTLVEHELVVAQRPFVPLPDAPMLLTNYLRLATATATATATIITE